VADVGGILGDLAEEGRELDDVVADADWATPTPAQGWTIAHQIAHLTWTDSRALIAVRTPDEFGAELKRALAAGETYVDDAAAEGAVKPAAELLAEWRTTRAELAEALETAPPDRKFPWYGPPMSAASMATARLMETWAHGLDVADALGVTRPATARLRSIAHIGVRTRDFAFVINELSPPVEPFRVELRAPDGSLWAWGPEAATQRVTGSAEDFCFLVTQRRPLHELDVTVSGDDAARWLPIAQAFAGPPGGGR
jgi:uncharacterized protein (TIGR03084 family)